MCVKSEVEAEDSMYKEIRLQTDCTQNPVLRNWTVKKKEKKRRSGKKLYGDQTPGELSRSECH